MIKEDSKRLNNVLESLSEARKSLQNWQDQRTEALISIDSFTYDVRLLQEEKNQILEEYQKSQEVFLAREQDYLNQIEKLKKEALSLMGDKEAIQKTLETSNIHAARLETDIQNLNQKIEQTKVETKARIADLRRDDFTKIERLNVELSTVISERDSLDARARKAELELHSLRSQLHSILNHSETSLGETVIEKNIGDKITLDKNVPEKPARELVQDYLKRLGY